MGIQLQNAEEMDMSSDIMDTTDADDYDDDASSDEDDDSDDDAEEEVDDATSPKKVPTRIPSVILSDENERLVGNG